MALLYSIEELVALGSHVSSAFHSENSFHMTSYAAKTVIKIICVGVPIIFFFLFLFLFLTLFEERKSPATIEMEKAVNESAIGKLRQNEEALGGL